MVEVGVIGIIGREVVRADMKILEVAAGDDPSLELRFTEFPWGCEYYLLRTRVYRDEKQGAED